MTPPVPPASSTAPPVTTSATAIPSGPRPPMEKRAEPPAHNDFNLALAGHNTPLTRSRPEILQLNLGKLCNLTCVHCHVNAGPHRTEIISSKTLDRFLEWFEKTTIPTLDLTGGTPEMAPGFQHLVESVRGFDQPRRVMDRLNATIINEPGFEWVPGFLARHQVAIIASMPCYQAENVNAQRGEGVFDRSIAAFQLLNSLGYGRDPDLELNFVYNPNGAFLPGDQNALEADYKREIKRHFNIDFNQLYCIANMPVARFASYLKRNNQFADYLELLRNAFNPATVRGLMCRDTLSVSWTGQVYDCDFNQMLDLDLNPPAGANGANSDSPTFIWDVDPDSLSTIPIRTGSHCFGCTAGAGSSCGGQLA